MGFSSERTAFEAELDLYYRARPYDFTADEVELHEASRRHPEWSPYRRKIEGYRLGRALSCACISSLSLLF